MIEQLQPQSCAIQKLLRPQKVKNATSYRKASWTIEILQDNKEYMYNVLTKELVRVQNADRTDRHELIKRWFWVEDAFDEFEYAKQIKHFLKLLSSRTKGISNYTILTTTTCNARCYYCFERNRPKYVMSEQTSKQVIDFISRNYNGKTVSIQWFGGEPLINFTVMDFICAGLQQRDIPYFSAITTNGYLFSRNLIEHAIKEWRLRKVQVTLDGMSANYNAIKNYVYSDANPFDTVISNIGNLLASGVKVLIRLNMTLENVKELCLLVTFIYEKFNGNKLLKLYVCPIYDLINNENGASLGEGLNQIQDMIFKYKMDVPYEYFSKNRVNHCKADNDGHSIVIFPDGNMGWCEHILEESYIGDVEKYNRTHVPLPSCWHRYNIFDKCRKCVLYPDCLKLSDCDTNNACFEFISQYEIRRIIDTIRKEILHHET